MPLPVIVTPPLTVPRWVIATLPVLPRAVMVPSMMPVLSRALLALLPSNEIGGVPLTVPVTLTVRSSAGGAAKPLSSVPAHFTTGAPPGGSGAQAARAAVAPTESDPQASAVADRSRARGLMIGMAMILARVNGKFTERAGAANGFRSGGVD